VTCPLRGIDGRNPCGFLAALGALRLLSDHRRCEEPHLHWTGGTAGALQPTLSFAADKGEEQIASLIMEAHEQRDIDAELGWERDLMKISSDQARKFLTPLLMEAATLRAAQVVGACVVDVPRRRGARVDRDRLTPYTPLRLIPRVGRARFLATALSISRSVSKNQIRTALFGPWDYERTNSMRWDPGAPPSLRAYSAEAPTDFGPLGVPGAVTLAAAGLSYFPLIVTEGGKATCRGFSEPNARILRWPLWSSPLEESATRLTLGIPAVYEEPRDDDLLARHGIFARVSARRERLGEDDQVLSWGDVEMVGAD
jgi:hypothetical protein